MENSSKYTTDYSNIKQKGKNIRRKKRQKSELALPRETDKFAKLFQIILMGF